MPKKILIVDDNLQRNDLIRQTSIDRLGINASEIDFCTNTYDAQRFLAETKYDFLIIDVILPVHTGRPADFSNGFDLLDSATSNDSALYNPTHIIGITSCIDEIESFSVKFKKKCHIVLPVDVNSQEWLESIVAYISTKIHSPVVESITIITLHGLNTYGVWQHQLENACKNTSDRISVLHYRYGFRLLLGFIFSFLRENELKIFCSHFVKLLGELRTSKNYIIAHSFGTYLAIEGLRHIYELGFSPKFETVILCGSVLHHQYEIPESFKDNIKCIVNECGCRDVPVCISSLFIKGTGLAGRIGFLGFSGGQVINRYYSGGHSLYFKNYNKQPFFSSFWIPLFINGELTPVDDRKSTKFQGALDNIILLLSKTQRFNLILLMLLLFALIILFTS